MYRRRSPSGSPPPRARARAFSGPPNGPSSRGPPSRPQSRAPPSRPQSRAPSRARSRGASSSRSPSPQTPPRRPPPAQPSSRKKDRSGRGRGYSMPQDKRRGDVTLLLCVFHSTSHNWSTHPVKFNPSKTNDRELWEDIRYIFRTDLQKPWRRLLGFKKVKSIVPIGFSPNGVPIRTEAKDFPESKQFMHAYHHPETIRPDRRWVDWFAQFDAGDSRQNGLEFVEGLWADKLAAIAVIFSIAIVVVSIVWCVLGGQLQTVFTVMGFVLTMVAAQIALAALYYQVALPG